MILIHLPDLTSGTYLPTLPTYAMRKSAVEMLNKSYQERLSIERKSDRLEPESAVITSPFWVMNGIIKRTGRYLRYLSVARLFARLVALCCKRKSRCACAWSSCNR